MSLNFKKSNFAKVVLLGLAAAGTTISFAAPPDFSSLTTAVDLSTVITAIMAIAAVLAGVYVAIKGAKVVIGMIRGA